MSPYKAKSAIRQMVMIHRIALGLLHRPGQKAPHLLRRVLLHRLGDMPVGVEGKSRAVVAQQAGERLDVHAILERNRGKCMSQRMEGNFLHSGPFQNSMKHFQHTVRTHWPTLWRGEHVDAEPILPFLLFLEHLDHLRRDEDLAIGVLCFQRRFLDHTVEPRDLPLDVDAPLVEVDERGLDL